MSPRPTVLPIHEMLSRGARQFPDREAVVCRGSRWTYAEVDAAASKVARFLRASGVERGERIAICSPKCLAEVPLIFAIARAGCVLVHVNPSFRDEQVQHVVAQTEPAVVFFHESRAGHVDRLTRGKPRLSISMGPVTQRAPTAALSLDVILREPDPSQGTPPFEEVGDDDLAAILYTSGTTAKAKGIMVTHGIFSDATRVSAEVLGNVASDRLISLTPFSFDGALSQLFTAVHVGGTLVLQDSQFPRDVVRTLTEERITGLHAVPSFWRMMLERDPGFPERVFPHLRYLTLIGEVFPERDLLKLKSILRTTDFFMMYGTTEAFRSTCLPPADFERKRGSVGKPLPGVEIDIVDEKGNRCAAGQVGEIVHRGAFVSPGYWRRAGDARFRDGAVYTGDLGKLDSEGYLYFAGRKDTMVKHLGYQVFPEDIEACIAMLEDVAQAAVISTSGADHVPRLHAFVVPGPGSALTEEAVAGHCKRHLPHYMQPHEILLRPELPMTGTRKIDRALLSTMVTP